MNRKVIHSKHLISRKTEYNKKVISNIGNTHGRLNFIGSSKDFLSVKTGALLA